MKIILITDVFPPHFKTSVGTIVENLAQEFVQKGHKVLVITTTANKKETRENIYHGLKVAHVYARLSDWARSYLCLYNPQTIKAVKKILQEFQPDIVHAHLVHHLLSYHTLKLAKKTGTKVFLTAHDVQLFHYGKFYEFIEQNNCSIPQNFNYKINTWQLIKRFKKRYNPFRNLIIRHYLKYVDKIFAVSFALKEALNQNGIKNVEVIYNGINANDWQVSQEKIEQFKNRYNLSGKKIVLFAGRLSGLKGGEQVIRALKIVKQKIPEIVLLVAGEKKGYGEQMTNLVSNLEVPLILTGWLTKDELKAAYFCSNVVATPSICLDTFNLINIEAMAAKKPVVGTCFGGTPEIVVDGKTGYVVNPYNTAMMAEKIIDLLSHADKAQEFGQAGYERVKRYFNLSTQVEKTLSWYEKSL